MSNSRWINNNRLWRRYLCSGASGYWTFALWIQERVKRKTMGQKGKWYGPGLEMSSPGSKNTWLGGREESCLARKEWRSQKACEIWVETSEKKGEPGTAALRRVTLGRNCVRKTSESWHVIASLFLMLLVDETVPK